jgi:type I restriction enzyme, S subunit
VLVEKFEKRLYLSDKVLRLVVPAESKRWINYAMKTVVVRKAIQNASSGNQLSMRNISQEKLRQIPIPLAPLPEQKRIADKLDSVLARVDACRDRLPALLKRFRQSILAAATSGQLTEDWRINNSCPRQWTEEPLGALILEMRNGLSPKPSEQPPGTKILRISAVRPGTLDFDDHRYLVVDSATLNQYQLKQDDLLFTRYNGSLDFVGVCAIVPEPSEGFVYPDKLGRVHSNQI